MTNLRRIEGGRDIHARTVLAEFAKATLDISTEHTLPAGFIILMWDDEGFVAGTSFQGERCPYSEPMLEQVLIDTIKRTLAEE